jgi:hypothetical protein
MMKSSYQCRMYRKASSSDSAATQHTWGALSTVYGRVMLAGGETVQLGDKKGFVFRQSPEAEALSRWTKREFLDVERNIAKD